MSYSKQVNDEILVAIAATATTDRITVESLSAYE
jgi:hypothetical protein